MAVSSSIATLVIASGVLACILLTARFTTKRHQRKSLPPGPPGWPIIGNISNFPKKDKWTTFAEWAQRYGDLTYVNLFGTDMIIVNSMPALSALFEGKSANFSDRPFMYFSCEMVGWKELTAFMNIGPAHTFQRKLITQAIGTKTTMAGLQGMVDHQVRLFTQCIIAEPDRVYHHLRTLAAAIVLAITYGYDVEGPQDRLVLLADKVTTDLGRAFAPGAYLVDFIPLLKHYPSWMPGGGFKRDAAAMKADRAAFMNDPYEFALRRLTDGVASSSFVAHHLSTRELASSEESQIKCTASMLYMGGADTSVSAIYTFILCMLLHPEVQEKAQAEIDSVMGTEHDHFPTTEECSRMPYLQACLKECLRWSPPSPNSLVHQVRSEDVYSGYRVPKGTLIIPNIWWFAHDPNNYTNPSIFNPDRFLGDTPELDPREYVFSIGRRSCPGQLLAENTILTTASHILALVNLVRAKGPDGGDLPVEIEYSGEAVTIAKEFPVSVQARSTKVHRLFQENIG